MGKKQKQTSEHGTEYKAKVGVVSPCMFEFMNLTINVKVGMLKINAVIYNTREVICMNKEKAVKITSGLSILIHQNIALIHSFDLKFLEYIW